MYTLKIKWVRYEEGVLEDETTLFIPADELQTHAQLNSMEEMSAWEEGSYFDYVHKTDAGEPSGVMRLIRVTKAEKLTWYLASAAWILGPDGKTIERLV